MFNPADIKPGSLIYSILLNKPGFGLVIQVFLDLPPLIVLKLLVNGKIKLLSLPDKQLEGHVQTI